ncbi:MAG TPA: VOC family protein [Rhizomicrobium sp.]|nr:VOC family protein [Rhizomicrobium sp.]
MSEQPEFYPMPSFPALSVKDADASSRWYQSALGFQHVFTMPGPGGGTGLVHLRWAKYADLLLRASPPIIETKGIGITLNYAVTDGGLDALAERARKAQAIFIQEPGDRPWNARDFTVADPDGFALTFTMGPLKRDLTMDALMDRIAKS